MKIFYKGFNYGQDGPGNRLVYHVSGCNLHCPWCSNPEGMDGKAGTPYTPSEIFAEAQRSRMMFFGGGGVTFTGGEATLEHDDLMMTLRMLCKAGIHTAIETNGTSPGLVQVSRYVDYLMMDYKHFDAKTLLDITGAAIEDVENNLLGVASEGGFIHIRIPLIHGFNDENPEGFARALKEYANCIDVELLAYHEYGRGKWPGSYQVTEGFVTEEVMERFRRTLMAAGLKLIHT